MVCDCAGCSMVRVTTSEITLAGLNVAGRLKR
jgi:hypothetical protein